MCPILIYQALISIVFEIRLVFVFPIKVKAIPYLIGIAVTIKLQKVSS